MVSFLKNAFVQMLKCYEMPELIPKLKNRYILVIKNEHHCLF